MIKSKLMTFMEFRDELNKMIIGFGKQTKDRLDGTNSRLTSLTSAQEKVIDAFIAEHENLRRDRDNIREAYHGVYQCNMALKEQLRKHKLYLYVLSALSIIAIGMTVITIVIG